MSITPKVFATVVSVICASASARLMPHNICSGRHDDLLRSLPCLLVLWGKPSPGCE